MLPSLMTITARFANACEDVIAGASDPHVRALSLCYLGVSEDAESGTWQFTLEANDCFLTRYMLSYREIAVSTFDPMRALAHRMIDLLVRERARITDPARLPA